MTAGVPALTTSHMAINGEWVGAVSGQFFEHCIRAPAEHRPQSHHDCEAVAGVLRVTHACRVTVYVAMGGYAAHRSASSASTRAALRHERGSRSCHSSTSSAG